MCSCEDSLGLWKKGISRLAYGIVRLPRPAVTYDRDVETH